MIDILQTYWKNYLYTNGYQYTGLVITLWLLVISLLIGFGFSILFAIARCSNKKWLKFPVWLFTYIFRGTPLYVQLLLCYSGLFSLQFIRDSATLSDFFQSGMNCTILALTLNTCAYTTEIFAGAIRSTSRSEMEAAKAYGLSTFKIYLHIILPSALRRSLPLYGNEVIFMLHATTLAFTATVPDILKVARDVNAATYQSFDAFGIAAILYIIISSVIVYLFRRAEKVWMAYLKPLQQ